ncbi:MULTISPECIES: hypothetical protein [Cyanophyceae]|uniref:hypothetical protein n=1 Tax=Cyanophyceae TaxID=3028117 RepID=UPI001682ECDE|nr:MULTISPECIES: hypothetical protein [Cyanophyceae]MBD1917174.1 hypothetical protein [Phormidium sp. FACHB-77]MBD2030705.1 hypothetical protein [Phormidium sp. FACHB-322]MBD2050187.1 hypothetical protein [Leptolyngbya sp. FACHB-60]
MTDQQILDLKDALRLKVTNRAISNVHTRLGLAGQISAAIVALCYPIGVIIAGPIGLWAMIALATAVAGGSLAAIRQESSAIATGDATKARQYLSPEELIEFNDAAVQIQAAASKKPMGAAPATQESGSGTNPPAPGSKSADVAPVPFAPIKLDPDCPHFLLLAGTREGKTNALRCLLDGHARVNYVSTKATDKIPAHWDGYVLGGTPEDKGKQLQWLLAHWGAKLAAHAEGTDTEPEWFVFDEAIQIQTYAKRSKVKGLADAIAGLQVEIATQGAAIAAYGVLLAQTKNAGPLGIDLDLLQQNFRMVLPLKSKRRLALSVIEKMGGLRLTTEQREDILSNPNRYLQLWLGEDEDIYHDVLPEFQGELKPLVKCPTEDASSPEPSPQETTEPKPLGVKILDYLKGHGEAKTAREIRGACTRSSDSPRASVDEVRDLLALMISEGQITRWEDGNTDRYQVTGTV